MKLHISKKCKNSPFVAVIKYQGRISSGGMLISPIVIERGVSRGRMLVIRARSPPAPPLI